MHPCCGDGVVTSAVGEQCDDGNTVSGDGCNLECKSERAGAACCNAGDTEHNTREEYAMELGLQDKVVIITGAASGIGRASLRAFAAEGARVLAVDINAAQLAEVPQITSKGSWSRPWRNCRPHA